MDKIGIHSSDGVVSRGFYNRNGHVHMSFVWTDGSETIIRFWAYKQIDRIDRPNATADWTNTWSIT